MENLLVWEVCPENGIFAVKSYIEQSGVKPLFCNTLFDGLMGNYL